MPQWPLTRARRPTVAEDLGNLGLDCTWYLVQRTDDGGQAWPQYSAPHHQTQSPGCPLVCPLVLHRPCTSPSVLHSTCLAASTSFQLWTPALRVDSSITSPSPYYPIITLRRPHSHLCALPSFIQEYLPLPSLSILSLTVFIHWPQGVPLLPSSRRPPRFVPVDFPASPHPPPGTSTTARFLPDNETSVHSDSW
jgi:hypothetical protein